MSQDPRREEAPESDRPPRLWPYILLGLVLAAWINLGQFHRYHQSDSLVPVLMSVYRWTPCFWESNHPGMLVPLLARPFKGLLLNLLVQGTINAGLGLSAFFLLARYLLRSAAYPIAALAGIAGFVAFAPPHYIFDFLFSSLYGTWLGLGLSALALLEAGPTARVGVVRRAAALGLFLLAHWVYAATSLVLGPLVVARWLLARRGGGGFGGRLVELVRGETGIALRQMAVATAAGLAVLHFTPSLHAIETGSIPVSAWPAACARFVANLGRELTGLHVGFSYAPSARHRLWPGFLVAALAAGLLARLWAGVRGRRGDWRAGLVPALVALLAAATNTVYLASRSYIAGLGHFHRYLEPAAFLVQGGLLALAAAWLCAGRSRRLLGVLRLSGACACALAIGATFGLPSLAVVRADLDQRLGGDTAAILSGRATHVAGDYWRVWPAVFHANLVLQERGERRTVWGVTGNARPTAALWRRLPRASLRVALHAVGPARSDPWLDSLAHVLFEDFRLTGLNRAERVGNVWILSPGDGSSGQASGSCLPVPADYDGDGRADVAVFRVEAGSWEIVGSRGGVLSRVSHGAGGLPVPADYDGDGLADVAVFQFESGEWSLRLSSGAERLISFGGPRMDLPAPADYDGDGRSDVALYRPSSSLWLIQLSTGGTRSIGLGAPGLDLPAPADYDGDGFADAATLRPGLALWSIHPCGDAGPPRIVEFTSARGPRVR